MAPETAIDFDVMGMKTGRAFLWMLSGFSLFFFLYEGVKHYDPKHLKRYVVSLSERNL